MANTYPITPEQEAVLRSFTCERLTANEKNLTLIQYFRSARGGGLVQNLLENGWVNDTNGTIAYYVIKNPEGRIVMFFSLKCGVLFDPHYMSDFLEKYKDTENYKKWQDYCDEDPDAIRYFRDLERRMGKYQYEKLINDLKKCDWIKLDKRTEPNQMMIRVKEGHSAVELVEFCANDRTKRCWKRYGMEPKRMGETLFWWFIVPKMLEVSKLIGCEYAFLFAADETPDGELVRYYESAFHFKKMTNLGTVKPFYDMNCYFMGKRLRNATCDFYDFADGGDDQDEETDLRGLEAHREEFFQNFNESREAPDNV